ncbi:MULTISPECIES: M48 family metallopeptidase [Bartonella]|uniref:tetratricopeptide repeat protein n=1 Tax=Bartonella TaxID=773 RepID=UPI0018DC85B6|nr:MULTISPECIES: tetratricopeptide repeat protein [Bartonella]MBH9995708.1 tetratricopeptide repeat protein [Bartonella sp. P0291]MBH9995948.1 tetratricopeptide repeat protein [Bartonella sp. M0192]MBH9998108.1 tetratricopeptide repeat protein [Bartonella sp. M0191]MBI0009038.1 tetratricopeptide repeat protein [Bartonella sp. M0193]MBI0009399.1 tetratricopeptide repeat protein [Bartonella sp. M0176]
MMNKWKIRFFIISLSIITAMSPSLVFSQGLPELPPQEDPDSPPLSPEDMIPDKPSREEALPDLGKDQNAAQKKQAELDHLLAVLKRTANQKEAAKISRQIQGLWSQSGSDTIDLLMQWAEDGINQQDYARALDFLDNVVALQPDYAEGWARRAAVHVQLNDLKLAMSDLHRSLSLEPRNYNALFLVGSILEMTGRNKLALHAYEDALQIYPQMQRAQKRVGDILEEQIGRAI